MCVMFLSSYFFLKTGLDNLNDKKINKYIFFNDIQQIKVNPFIHKILKYFIFESFWFL